MKSRILEMLSTDYRNHQKIYTDASIIHDEAGIGIVIPEQNICISKKIENNSCIMTAEIIAISEALKIIFEKKDKLSLKVILTDSQSACWHFINEMQKNTTCELTYNILNLANLTNTCIQWIPGHIDIQGNTKADHLAKEGINSNLTINNKITFKDAIYKCSIDRNDHFNSWYIEQSQVKGKHLYEIFKQIKQYPWFYKTSLNRKEVRTLNRILSGHDFSRKWLYKMKLVDNPYCDICPEEESVEHLIMNCVKYNNVRQSFKFDIYTNLKDILRSNNIELYKELVQFLILIEKDI